MFKAHKEGSQHRLGIRILSIILLFGSVSLGVSKTQILLISTYDMCNDGALVDRLCNSRQEKSEVLLQNLSEKISWVSPVDCGRKANNKREDLRPSNDIISKDSLSISSPDY
jgi:hypothetical protein